MKQEFAEAAEVAPVSNASDVSRSNSASEEDRRNAPDRRRRTLHSLLYGNFNPRRRSARRTGLPTLRDVDWHHPQWLAVGMLIVVLSCVDAALTLTLIERGAYEV